MTAITIDETGCLAIPLDIRQQLGLTVAKSLNLEIINGSRQLGLNLTN